MKRVLTITLTLAMLGSLMFMGMAGTTAAQDVSVDQDANSTVEVNTNQGNANAQIQNAQAYSSSHKSYASTTAVQGQTVDQGNLNDQTIVSVALNNADINIDDGIDEENDEPVL